jgi:hypothetical protein
MDTVILVVQEGMQVRYTVLLQHTVPEEEEVEGVRVTVTAY